MKHFISYVSGLLALRRGVVQSAFKLLDEGHTVPFIARYRASKVGNIDAEQLYVLHNFHKQFETIDKLRVNRMEKLRQRSLLTPQLESSFQECVTIDRLDDLWIPFKAEKKESDVVKASSIQGLHELSMELLAVTAAKKQLGPLQLGTSASYPDFPAQQGLLTILIQSIIMDPEVRTEVKAFLSTNIQVSSNFKKKVTEEEKVRSNFRDYDNYNRRLQTIPHHQLLALRRGKDDSDELTVKVNVVSDSAVVALMHKILEKFQVHAHSCRVHVSQNGTKYEEFVQSFCQTNRLAILINRDRLVGEACCEALRSHLIKSVTNELYKEAIKQAEEKALNVFAVNLRKILMVPPLVEFYQIPSLSSSLSSSSSSASFTEGGGGGVVICGIDPGMKNGHKIAILDSNQRLVETAVLKYSIDANSSVTRLTEMCLRYNVDICSIGDGVGCLEAQEMVGKMLQKQKQDEKEHGTSRNGIGYVVVSEAGASVYSASKVAVMEYPGVEITYLGAISIAQRLRDPLSELVKIKPASLGVGMYQRDLDVKTIDARLSQVVELCLNEVGVDMASSSIHLMKRTSGLSSKQAEAIVEATKAGKIKSRQDLMKIKGFGPVAYKNAAGFLRIKGGDNPLDNTCIHPEQYEVVNKLLDSIGFTKTHGKLQHIHINDSRSLLYEHIQAVKDWNILADQIGVELSIIIDIIGWLLSSNPFSTDATTMYKLQNIEDFKLRRMCEVGIPPEIKTTPISLSSLRNTDERSGGNVFDKNNSKDWNFRVGSVVAGTIRNITPFGAFVDLGVQGRMLSDRRLNTGLLHSSVVDLDTVTIGQVIEVEIKNIDKERGRVGLGLCQHRDQKHKNKDDNKKKFNSTKRKYHDEDITIANTAKKKSKK